MTRLYVSIDSHCLHSYHEDIDYGSWEERWNHTLDFVSIREGRSSYNSHPIDYDVKIGDKVYVVWAIYSSGDSFGRGESKYFDVVHIFKDKDLAWDAYRILNNTPDTGGLSSYQTWRVNIKTDSGKDMDYSRPWMGYFDELVELRVDETTVTEY